MVRALLARLWPFSAGNSGDEQIRTWDVIPNWQYDGWQVETGGLTVSEQEEALAEIREQAEAVEEAESIEEADPDHPDAPEEP